MNSELITLRKTVEDLTDRMRALEEQLILSKQTIFSTYFFFFFFSFFFFFFFFFLFFEKKKKALAQEVERERSNTTIALNSFQELIKLNLGVPLPQLRKIARAVPKDGVSGIVFNGIFSFFLFFSKELQKNSKCHFRSIVLVHLSQLLNKFGACIIQIIY